MTNCDAPVECDVNGPNSLARLCTWRAWGVPISLAVSLAARVHALKLSRGARLSG